MLFRDFKRVLELLENCYSMQIKASDYLSFKVFEPHTELITHLLSQLYEKEAVEHVLNEWLIGNRKPLTYTPKGSDVAVAIPLETANDLWKAMELFKKK